MIGVQSRLVKPRPGHLLHHESGCHLSDLARETFGISEELIKTSGQPIEVILDELDQFVKTKCHSESGRTFALITDGQNHLRQVIHPQTAQRNIQLASYFYSFYDLRKEFCKFYQLPNSIFNTTITQLNHSLSSNNINNEMLHSHSHLHHMHPHHPHHHHHHHPHQLSMLPNSSPSNSNSSSSASSTVSSSEHLTINIHHHHHHHHHHRDHSAMVDGDTGTESPPIVSPLPSGSDVSSDSGNCSRHSSSPGCSSGGGNTSSSSSSSTSSCMLNSPSSSSSSPAASSSSLSLASLASSSTQLPTSNLVNNGNAAASTTTTNNSNTNSNSNTGSSINESNSMAMSTSASDSMQQLTSSSHHQGPSKPAQGPQQAQQMQIQPQASQQQQQQQQQVQRQQQQPQQQVDVASFTCTPSPIDIMLNHLSIEADASADAVVSRVQNMAKIIIRMINDGHTFTSPEEIYNRLQPGLCIRGDPIDGNTVVRARGLPWQSSDQDVAKFFRGLDIGK